MVFFSAASDLMGVLVVQVKWPLPMVQDAGAGMMGRVWARERKEINKNSPMQDKYFIVLTKDVQKRSDWF